MLNQEKIRARFDEWAAEWDAHQETDAWVIKDVLDAAKIGEGSRVLDIACGTGVLFPYYRQRGVSNVTGVDFSPKMAAIAAGKVKHDPIFRVISRDATELEFRNQFDAVVVYDSLPHFSDIGKLIRKAYAYLAQDGMLVIAHSAGRAKINQHHVQVPDISNELLSAKELFAMMRPYFKVERVLDDSHAYLVAGIRKERLDAGDTKTYFAKTGEHAAEAYHILLAEHHSIAAGHADGTYYFQDRKGVSSLLEWHDRPEILKDAFVADKVVGKAAALLMAGAGVKEVYADTASTEGCRILEEAKIPYNFSALVPYIENRTKDDMCPMEKSVRGIENPADAYEVLKAAAEKMKKG